MSPKPKHIDYKKELNPAQLEAVMFDDGPLLVIAGAGSGKTRTLTYRVARLVEAGVPPAAILLLTFTRKASAEMLTRACRLLDNRCGKVSGGTFHSFANAILRRYAAVCGFESGFSIMDRADAESLIGMVKKELGISSKKRAFPRNQTLANIFSRGVNKGLSVDEVVFNDYPHFASAADDLTALFNLYSERKLQLNFLDYDDLLVYLYRLLRDRSDIRQNLSATYRYIMVDEYQDTNHLQAEILYHLADRNHNVMAVGDDSQSIYAFRGANFKNIIDFPRIFPGTTIIGLEENYRSVQPILSLTNAVIDRAAEKYDKKLFTRRKGGHPAVLGGHGQRKQPVAVCRRQGPGNRGHRRALEPDRRSFPRQFSLFRLGDRTVSRAGAVCQSRRVQIYGIGPYQRPVGPHACCSESLRQNQLVPTAAAAGKNRSEIRPRHL
jgi:DNA helicase-2/ATP-dependent DNA helicase PcrA